MKRFEYRILDVRMWEYSAPSRVNKERELDDCGLEGFELVSVSKGYAFLKREMLEPTIRIAEAKGE